MRLFLLSLGILFAAALLGYLIIRVRAGQWPPAGSPALPSGLWLSTAVLAAVGALLVAAVRCARTSVPAPRLRNRLAATTALGVAFLAVQVGNWMQIAASEAAARQSMLAFVFLMLTVLHAIHVVGGLVPLTLVTVRAARGRYRRDPEPIELVASYWHFLGVTWLAILVALVV